MHVRRKKDKFLKLLEQIEGREVIAFDLETTGLSSKEDKILQISALKCICQNGEFVEIDRMNQFINPEMDLSNCYVKCKNEAGILETKCITELNHISNETVAGCPTIEEFFPTLKAFFGNTPIVVGYNSNFDIRFTNANYEKCSNESFVPEIHLDVYEFVKDVVEVASKKENQTSDAKDTKPENRKLSTIASYYGMDANFHDALDDILSTLFLIYKIKEDYEEELFVSEEIEKIELIPISANYWAKGSNKRLYVKTDRGDIYYDLVHKEWHEKDIVGLDHCNLEKLEKDVADIGVFSHEYDVSISCTDMFRVTAKKRA